ncbi:MAG: nitrile hydratase accessory protein [Alphaproteobacteria bacterium]|nr:nitrile hydratase accessory protein [Alphaproteobacteria bacterium]HCP00430.1 nitrile hydratase accessory protein [Rhodospirillaceae bacterium]
MTVASYGAREPSQGTLSRPTFGRVILRPPVKPDRPFAEPWHGKLFALTHALVGAGHFTWSDWTTHFGVALERARVLDNSTDGSDYYDTWLEALERFLADRRHTDLDQIEALEAAWTAAYLRTPHGAPVEL